MYRLGLTPGKRRNQPRDKTVAWFACRAVMCCYFHNYLVGAILLNTCTLPPVTVPVKNVIPVLGDINLP